MAFNIDITSLDLTARETVILQLFIDSLLNRIRDMKFSDVAAVVAELKNDLVNLKAALSNKLAALQTIIDSGGTPDQIQAVVDDLKGIDASLDATVSSLATAVPDSGTGTGGTDTGGGSTGGTDTGDTTGSGGTTGGTGSGSTDGGTSGDGTGNPLPDNPALGGL